jgi:hypothetical protein
MVNFPTDRSVMVITNYRTGSTALCDYISKQTGLLNCDEVFHHADAECYYDRVKDKKIVFKVMPDHRFQEQWKTLASECYIVGLHRQNIAEQIASLCIAKQGKTWHYVKENVSQPNILNNPDHSPFPILTTDRISAIKIDRLAVEDECRYILEMYIKYRMYRRFFNTELVYEDIKGELAISDYSVYPKPNNYQELIDIVKHLLINVDGIAELYKEYAGVSTR